MGIDVYLEWDNQSSEESEAQCTGFDIHSGHVGYLREAYHGEPYATGVLISEDWAKQPKKGFVIPNTELRKRLPEVMKAAIQRELEIYKSTNMLNVFLSMKSFYDFVELHEKMEKEGRNPRIIISY